MPTFHDLASWVGAQRVIRANRTAIADWQIPESQKLTLISTGIPIVDQLIEHVDFQPEPHPTLTTTSEPLYRLTRNHHGDIKPGLTWSFGTQPNTGIVYYVLPGGDAWFANSTIDLWLRTLHHYGRHVSQSPILNDPDEHEDEALTELQRLADELKAIDPPAFDSYQGFIWAEFLDRWLW
ncbi:SUKH-4 family immunity protein [Nonomuraea endophytica]|uniref:SUKH-4 immunity protein n=1 Tax=Nonomuraea endophytica TaxID=714136 RepID=A0A7W7ZX77_9ACTN|nr:SUKH-4 family immunity protein [Nonomuraea endophytica]MBB5074975.1 hypothetical protein [Nonomuraea endophytica]